MSKLLLVKLPNASLYKDKNLTILEPLGLEYLASAVQDKHNVLMYDLDTSPYKAFLNILKLFSPDYVGSTVSTPMVLEAKELVDIVKKYNYNSGNKIITILGGAHSTALPEETINFTGTDIVVVGEGEVLVREILDNKQQKGIFHNNQKLDINKLKKPSRGLLDRNNYKVSYSFDKSKKLQRCASVIISRGCPFPCNFCASKSIFGSSVRFRDIDFIIEEIEDLINNYGVEAILFLDDTFTLREDKVISLCEKILKKNLKFYWWLDTRVDKISKELLEIMYEAGCKFIVYGVESGSQEVLDRIGKKISIQQVKDIFRITHEVGIETKANFMFGHLEETEKDIEMSIQLAKELKAFRYGFYLVLPLPGSPLYSIAVKNNLITKSFDKFKWYADPVSNISKVSSERLKSYQQLAYRSVK